MRIPVEFINEIQDTTDSFQKECHSLIDRLTSDVKGIQHQDATNVWIFNKLAEFHVRLKNIEKLLS